MEDTLRTIDQMSKKLQVPKSWLYSRTRQTGPETIPHVKLGKYVRFVEEDVMAWVKKRNG